MLRGYGCMLVPVTFATAYHAFAVDARIDWLAVKPRQLSDHTKHHLFCLNGQHYVSMRHTVIGLIALFIFCTL